MMADLEHIPAWLTAAADQRAQEIQDNLDDADLPATTLIMAMLTEPGPFASDEGVEAWDTACDNCKQVSPPGFMTSTISKPIKQGTLSLTVGVCAQCLALP